MDIPIDDPRWIPAIKNPPKVGAIVIGLAQHWTWNASEAAKVPKRIPHQIVELKAVDESDNNFRTTDDNSEIDYNWTITHWMPKEQ